MTDTEALDEIDDLFATKQVRSRGTSKRSLQALRDIRARGTEAAIRNSLFCDTKRPAPTLPRVKWLERPDPFES